MRIIYLGLLFIGILLSVKTACSQEKEALFPMQDKYKWGFINEKGKWVIKPQFPYVLSFRNGLAGARKPGVNQWGYINQQGEWAIKPQFGKKLKAYRTYAGKKWYSPAIGPFRDQRAVARIGDTLATISKSGDIINRYPDYEGLRRPREGRGAFKKDDEWGFMNQNQEVVIEPQYEEVQNFHQGLAAVKESFGANFGFINKAGKTVIKPQYEEVGHFANGLAPAKTGAFEPWGYINKSGEWAIEPQYDKATAFSEGLAFVKNEETSQYINKAGKTVIKCDFEDREVCHSHGFRNGLALVSLIKKGASCNRSFSFFPFKKPSEAAYAYMNKKGEIIYQQPFEDALHLKKRYDSIQKAEKQREKRMEKARAKRERQQLADCQDFKAYGDESASSYLEISYKGVKRRFYYHNDVFQKKSNDRYRYHIPPFQKATGKAFLAFQPLRMEPSFLNEGELEVNDLGYSYSLRGNDCIEFPSDATDDARKVNVIKKPGTNLWKKAKVKFTNPQDTQSYVLIHAVPDQYKKPANPDKGTETSGFIKQEGQQIDLTMVQFKYHPNKNTLEVSGQASKPNDDGGRRIFNAGANIHSFKKKPGNYYNKAVHRFDDHYIEYFKVLTYSDEKVHIKHYQKTLSAQDNGHHKNVNKDDLAFKQEYLEAEYIGSGVIKAVDPEPVKYKLE